MSLTSHGYHCVCGEYWEMCGRSIGCCLLPSGRDSWLFNFSLYLYFYWCIVDLCRFMRFWMSNPFSYRLGYTDSSKGVEGHVSPQIPEFYACDTETGDGSVLLPLWRLPMAIFMMTVYLLFWRLLGFFIPFLWLLCDLYISCTWSLHDYSRDLYMISHVIRVWSATGSVCDEISRFHSCWVPLFLV